MATLWYYAHEGQQAGPVPLDKLKAMTETGELVPTDLVWANGMASWVPASEVPDLFPAPPPMPMAKVRLYEEQKQERFKVYIDGNFLTESGTGGGERGFDSQFEVAPGTHVVEVIWFYNTDVGDRKKFTIKLPKPGDYTIRFNFVRTYRKKTLKKAGWFEDQWEYGPEPTHPMENSTIDILQQPK